MKSVKEFLKDYDITKFDRPSVATDIVCFAISTTDGDSFRKDPSTKLSVLLIKRAEHPFEDMWALPGGFVKIDETVEQGALREVVEETDVHPSALIYTGVFSNVNRDPRGRVISNAFSSIFNAKPPTKAGTDAKESRWFDVSLKCENDGCFALTLTSGDITLVTKLCEEKSPFGIKEFSICSENNLAFDHAQIIATAIMMLRAKVSRFELLFDFLPSEFTLASLQRVFDAITDTMSLTANFRRKVSEFVEETGEYTQGAGHRPAMLYRKKVAD